MNAIRMKQLPVTCLTRSHVNRRLTIQLDSVYSAAVSLSTHYVRENIERVTPMIFLIDSEPSI